jgi:hypothetical protein
MEASVIDQIIGIGEKDYISMSLHSLSRPPFYLALGVAKHRLWCRPPPEQTLTSHISNETDRRAGCQQNLFEVWARLCAMVVLSLSLSVCVCVWWRSNRPRRRQSSFVMGTRNERCRGGSTAFDPKTESE